MDHRTELRTVVELARLGNARRTAESLGVSQSTVSEVIARLERSYGTRLFDRDRRGSRSTATGTLVVDAARKSLDILDNVEREVGLLEGFERGVLSVAAHPEMVETHLVPAVASVLRESANLRCRVHSGTPESLLQKLRDQQIELFVGLEPDAPCGDVDVEPIGTYHAVPFCRAGHPLTEVPPQGIRVLREYPIISTHVPHWYLARRNVGLRIERELADEIAARGRTVQVAHLTTMTSLVAASDSLGFAATASIQRGIEDGSLAVLGVPDEQRALLAPAPIVLVTTKGRALPPVAKSVIAALRSNAATIGGRLS